MTSFTGSRICVTLLLFACLAVTWTIASGDMRRAISRVANAGGLGAYGTIPGAPFARPATCPDGNAITILIAGQSNAANTVPDRRQAGRGAYSLMGGHCHHLADPLPGASGWKGSMWPLFADGLTASTGRPVVLIGAAVGGSRVADWSSPYGHAIAGLPARITTATAAGLPVDLVIWIQGEADANRDTPAERYTAGLTRVIDRIDGLTGGSPWIIVPTALRIDGRQNMAIRRAQNMVIDAAPRRHRGPDLDRINGPGDRHDGVHLARAAADRVAAALAEQAAAIVAGR
ncbi:sialate O-acetylesterase [Tistrella sp. BH-R2-4]|uniref:Sialate O-acetylesterase n=1 Tax=Tistrella arctica TaxID=3133430 RepID=A0ABU9YSY5_9PROT